ncbi:hypothetical protein ACSZNX_03775 [Aeromonas veronii]|uniref:hypothetical protein n=1 Tax=Aeromonas veronii TaxID=654 RepID=UPI003EC69B33
MKNMIRNAPKMTIIASMLLAAGVANAAGEGGLDVTGVQTAVLAAVTALLGFVASVGLAKAGLAAPSGAGVKSQVLLAASNIMLQLQGAAIAAPFSLERTP